MSGILLSPSMQAKLKNRDSARKIKHGSPKLQEVLRKRCRERMREKRGQLFNRGRCNVEGTDEDVHEVLTEIVRRELSDLATSDWSDASSSSPLVDALLDPDEALVMESEIIAEGEQWILEEYERLSKNEEDMLALFAEEGMKEEVICPICQMAALAEAEEAILCSLCGLSLPSRVSLTDLGRIINDSVNFHSANCTEPSSFMVIPENSNLSLYLVCETCSILSLII